MWEKPCTWRVLSCVPEMRQIMVKPVVPFQASLPDMTLIPPSCFRSCSLSARMFFALRAAVVLSLLPIILSGCEKTASSEHRVHIIYWEKWTGAEETAIQQTVDAFNHSQNKIYVDELSVAQVDRKTLLATAGGDPPDVTGLWMHNMAAFTDCDALLPLDPFIRADGVSSSDYMARYSPVFADMCTLRGQIWGLPTAANAYALHWNKTLFRQAGLDPERPPRTVAELDAFSDQLTRKNANGEITQVGFLPQLPGWSAWAFPAWFGGDIFVNDQITVGNKPENVAAMQWVKGYTDRYGRDPMRAFISGAGSYASSQDPYFSGHAAMVIQGVWLNYFINQYAPGMDYGVAPWPEAVPGINDFTVAECDIVAIPRGAKHPQEAWEFIRYLNSSNPQARTREELGGMELLCYLQQKNSPLKVWSPFFTEQHPNPHIALFRQLANSPHAIHQPVMGIWQEYLREMNTMMDVVGLLVKSPEAALADCQKRIGESWAWHRESMDRRPPKSVAPRALTMNAAPRPDWPVAATVSR